MRTIICVSKIVATLFLNICLLANANAQTNYCTRTSPLTSNGWTMNPPGSVIENGTVIGRTTARISFNFPIRTGNNAKIISSASSGTESNKYSAIPLTDTPGVGLLVKWGGYSTSANLRVSQFSIGDPITTSSGGQIFDAIATANYDATFIYNFELIIIDKNKYKGGKLLVTNTRDALIATGISNVSGILTCQNGTFYLLSAVVAELNVPELPKAPAPTCTSADIGFTQKMPPVNASLIAANGGNRSDGTEGETYFRLIGKNCAKGTKISAYFTDSRAQSSSNIYLISSNPTIGVRLYHDQNQTPIQMGPAPIGSNLPTRPAIIGGPAQNDNSTLYIPITAQYIRLPGVNPANIKPGSMSAAAIVTFMYE